MTTTASLTLYGRAWCHLCEEMRVALGPLLAEFGAQLTVIDVDTDPLLEARYDEWVPVLVCDGVELCHYHFDEVRVRAALAAHASRVAAAS
ncbi:glutaredoxin family protein [Paraburkholderia sp. HP33-1]|uniref:glutaredoxin family protein n=1 Tax=Paraburkholderia sp. HP33-1 TaxID=2883243 RepID=UPI001F39C6C6|nr:glutaredoxin family protein [Paraburkholderia sp. HP33-1]